MAKSTNPMPLFLILMGTLAFSLSTLPKGEDSGHFTVTTLSSEFANSTEFESNCDKMGRNLGKGAEQGSCEINPIASKRDDATFYGRVEVKLVDIPARGAKIPARKEWERTTKIICEGKNCPRDPVEIVTSFDEEEAQKTARMDDFQTGLRKMLRLAQIAQENEKKERAEQDRRYRCEADRDGHKLNERDQMRCRIARVSKLDEEAAADYYEQYMLPKIQNMVGSSDVRLQRQGMDLLRQLAAAGVGGDWVKESVRDLAQFGQYKFQAEQQRIAIAGMNPNDPRLPGMVQQMRMQQFQADSYFHSRGINVDAVGWGTGPNGFDYSQVMMNNLNNFQNTLDQNYANILLKYQNMFQAPQTWQQQQQMANQQGATPNGPWPAAPPASQQLQQQQQQQLQQRTGQAQPFQQQQQQAAPQVSTQQYTGDWSPTGPVQTAPVQQQRTNTVSSSKAVLRPISKR